MEQEYQYMVCTGCSTFNHAPYIVDAMNGFAMQETTFPVCYLITDDASTDGEPEIIKQYLAEHFHSPYRTEETDDYHLICAVHKTNPNCTFIVFLLKYNHYSIKKSKLPYQAEWRDNAKYIAICEGDDYWIDSSKLQKQVDFLESHPDYSMCFHNAIEHWENKLKKDRLFSNIQDKNYEGVEIFEHWIVPTASVTIRSNVINSHLYQKVRESKLSRGDTPLFCTAASLGQIKGSPVIMSVYRRIGSGFTMKAKDYEWVRTFVRDTEQFPILFGREYEKISKSLVSNTIFDFAIKALVHGQLSEVKNYLRLLRGSNPYYNMKGLVTSPFRLIYSKLNKYVCHFF